MTPEECRLVQASFAQVDVDANRVAALFYGRLFELAPSLAPLFKTDMTLQGERFMEKLAIAVKGLDDLDSIAPFVRKLGRRHLAYGVKSVDYNVVEEALLWALEEELGPAFERDLKAAWSAAYWAISNMMIGAAERRV
ncbi:MAG: globin domain-containing protein [Candidatus Cybelea sp.]